MGVPWATKEMEGVSGVWEGSMWVMGLGWDWDGTYVWCMTLFSPHHIDSHPE